MLWGPLVRVFHVCVASAFFANYFFTEAGEAWHERVGYGAVAWVLVRTVWGFAGAGAASWRQFWPTPTRLREHCGQLIRGTGHAGLGHSPIGALVMILLMAGFLALGLTGYLLQQTDCFFGSESLEEVHEWLAKVMLALVAVHVTAAVVESLRLRENLPLSMITGYRFIGNDEQSSRTKEHLRSKELLGLAVAVAMVVGWLWVVLR